MSLPRRTQGLGLGGQQVGCCLQLGVDEDDVGQSPERGFWFYCPEQSHIRLKGVAGCWLFHPWTWLRSLQLFYLRSVLCWTNWEKSDKGWNDTLWASLYCDPTVVHLSCRLKGSFTTICLTPLAVSRYVNPGRGPPCLAHCSSNKMSLSSFNFTLSL